MGSTETAGSGSKGGNGASSSSEHIGTSSLDALQSQDSRKVMDIVDKLRQNGLSGILQLPQLVVSGDQSSGKSSVLEAITEIPFPRKENLCTRFATEIIMRRASTASIITKIIPDKQRPDTEKKKLEKFTSTILDFTELPSLVEEATDLMGLGDDGSGTVRAFSRDVLSIEIAGPGRPHLTLVDLPGLIHSDNKHQSKEDVELIRGLVDDYIKEKRTIIMAVVSAKNDYANQIILKKCREIDPKGSRTIGIITKPDFLKAGSENESSWIELAENKDIIFELGWHILKNRSDEEASKTFVERNSAEAAFFAQGRYRNLPSSMLGIESLRGRLSDMLYKHLKAELPSLRKELNEKLQEVTKELDKLGEKRATTHEQRRFLTTVSHEYQQVVEAAVDGRYESDFFGDLYPEGSVYHENALRRLRAVVQYLNLQFAVYHETKGLPLGHDIEGNEASELVLDDDYASFEENQLVETASEAIKRVRNMLVLSRGKELPGTFNPLLISQLFWKQSANWKAIAEFHVEKVAAVCSNFVTSAINSTVSKDVAARLQALRVDPTLTSRLHHAKAELIRIIADKNRHPITYDPAYTAIVQEKRHENHEEKYQHLVKQAEVHVFNPSTKQNDRFLKPDVLNSGRGALLELDMDKTSAQDALACQQAYYDEEVKYFIAAVTKQVIERYLLRDLAEDTISPMSILDMADEEVAFIAAEPEETTRSRANLEQKKATLEKGQQTFRMALGSFK
ncbi:hypothetical protein LTR49_008849 [Elasticomyces elasticus]|nr:hypothetical protein LTR49_008849 [Elasticomyces elasticus]